MIITRRTFLQGGLCASIASLGVITKTYEARGASLLNVTSFDYFDRVAAYVDARYAQRSGSSVSRVTSLDDLSGQTYTLVECEPAGVYILHDASGQFAEYGEEALSPYKGIYGHLIYGGPGVYLCGTAEGIVDLLTNKVINTNCDEITGQISAKMAEQHDSFFGNPNSELLKILQPSEDCVKSNDVLHAVKELVDRQIASTTTYNVPSAGFFYSSNKTYCGYCVCPVTGNGICGYVAANLMYRYWNYRGQVPLYSYWTSQSGVKNALYTTWLHSWGENNLNLSDSTCAWDISGLMNNICSNYGLTQAASWALLNANAWAEITTNLRPVILFGNLSGFGNHAYVAYGAVIDTLAQFYRCHMGWNTTGSTNYASYMVNNLSLIGSNMKCSY